MRVKKTVEAIIVPAGLALLLVCAGMARAQWQGGGGSSGGPGTVTTGAGLTGTGSPASPVALATPVSAANGGNGVASPTAHSIPIAEGASAEALVALATDQLLQGTTGADPAGVSIPNCAADAGHGLIYSTTTHAFTCQAITAAGVGAAASTGSSTLADVTPGGTNGTLSRFSNDRFLNVMAPQFNAACSTATQSATTTASNATIGVSAGNDFLNGQGVVLFHGGATQTMSTPAAPTVTASNPGAGATSYTYEVEDYDSLGGLTAVSPASTPVTNAATLATTVSVGSINNGSSLIITATSTGFNQGDTVTVQKAGVAAADLTTTISHCGEASAGAACANVLSATNGSITAGAGALSVADNTGITFNANMVGQRVRLFGSGGVQPDGTNGIQYATITAFTDATHVTVSTNATATVSGTLRVAVDGIALANTASSDGYATRIIDQVANTITHVLVAGATQAVILRSKNGGTTWAVIAVTRNATFVDAGGTTYPTPADDIPGGPQTTALNDNLVTSVISGGGTASLVLAVAPSQGPGPFILAHDDTAAITKALATARTTVGQFQGGLAVAIPGGRTCRVTALQFGGNSSGTNNARGVNFEGSSVGIVSPAGGESQASEILVYGDGGNFCTDSAVHYGEAGGILFGPSAGFDKIQNIRFLYNHAGLDCLVNIGHPVGQGGDPSDINFYNDTFESTGFGSGSTSTSGPTTVAIAVARSIDIYINDSQFRGFTKYIYNPTSYYNVGEIKRDLFFQLMPPYNQTNYQIDLASPETIVIAENTAEQGPNVVLLSGGGGESNPIRDNWIADMVNNNAGIPINVAAASNAQIRDNFIIGGGISIFTSAQGSNITGNYVSTPTLRGIMSIGGGVIEANSVQNLQPNAVAVDVRERTNTVNSNTLAVGGGAVASVGFSLGYPPNKVGSCIASSTQIQVTPAQNVGTQQLVDVCSFVFNNTVLTVLDNVNSTTYLRNLVGESVGAGPGTLTGFNLEFTPLSVSGALGALTSTAAATLLQDCTVALAPGHFTNLVIVNDLNGGTCTTAPSFNVRDDTAGTTGTAKAAGTAAGQVTQVETLPFSAGDRICLVRTANGATCTAPNFSVSAEAQRS